MEKYCIRIQRCRDIANLGRPRAPVSDKRRVGLTRKVLLHDERSMSLGRLLRKIIVT